MSSLFFSKCGQQKRDYSQNKRWYHKASSEFRRSAELSPAHSWSCPAALSSWSFQKTRGSCQARRVQDLYRATKQKLLPKEPKSFTTYCMNSAEGFSCSCSPMICIRDHTYTVQYFRLLFLMHKSLFKNKNKTKQTLLTWPVDMIPNMRNGRVCSCIYIPSLCPQPDKIMGVWGGTVVKYLLLYNY